MSGGLLSIDRPAVRFGSRQLEFRDASIREGVTGVWWWWWGGGLGGALGLRSLDERRVQTDNSRRVVNGSVGGGG